MQSAVDIRTRGFSALVANRFQDRPLSQKPAWGSRLSERSNNGPLRRQDPELHRFRTPRRIRSIEPDLPTQTYPRGPLRCCAVLPEDCFWPSATPELEYQEFVPLIRRTWSPRSKLLKWHG